jgi:hypothetical protein
MKMDFNYFINILLSFIPIVLVTYGLWKATIYSYKKNTRAWFIVNLILGIILYIVFFGLYLGFMRTFLSHSCC